MDDSELRRLVDEAARAARAAEEAASRMDREQPGRFEAILRAMTSLLTSFVDGLFGRLRAEIEGARRAGQEFTARVLRAVSRSLEHIMIALQLALLAALLATVGAAVLVWGLIVLFNDLLGEPWGTLLSGGIAVLAAWLAWRGAVARLRGIREEADDLAPRW